MYCTCFSKLKNDGIIGTVSYLYVGKERERNIYMVAEKHYRGRGENEKAGSREQSLQKKFLALFLL